MAVDVGIGRGRRERRQGMALTGRRRRWRLRVGVRVGMGAVGAAGTGERGRRRRHRRRYRRLGARRHHGDVGRRHGTRQCPGARQGAGVARDVTHYVTGRAHGRRVVGTADRVADARRRRARIRIVAHVTTVVHLHAVEADVVRRRRTRIADVTRLRHCNVRTVTC